MCDMVCISLFFLSLSSMYCMTFEWRGVDDRTSVSHTMRAAAESWCSKRCPRVGSRELDCVQFRWRTRIRSRLPTDRPLSLPEPVALAPAHLAEVQRHAQCRRQRRRRSVKLHSMPMASNVSSAAKTTPSIEASRDGGLHSGWLCARPIIAEVLVFFATTRAHAQWRHHEL